jgi:hypothetical protein
MMDMHVRQWHADDRLRPTAAAGGVPAHGCPQIALQLYKAVIAE